MGELLIFEESPLGNYIGSLKAEQLPKITTKRNDHGLQEYSKGDSKGTSGAVREQSGSSAPDDEARGRGRSTGKDRSFIRTLLSGSGRVARALRWVFDNVNREDPVADDIRSLLSHLQHTSGSVQTRRGVSGARHMPNLDAHRSAIRDRLRALGGLGALLGSAWGITACSVCSGAISGAFWGRSSVGNASVKLAACGVTGLWIIRSIWRFRVWAAAWLVARRVAAARRLFRTLSVAARLGIRQAVELELVARGYRAVQSIQRSTWVIADVWKPRASLRFRQLLPEVMQRFGRALGESGRALASESSECVVMGSTPSLGYLKFLKGLADKCAGLFLAQTCSSAVRALGTPAPPTRGNMNRGWWPLVASGPVPSAHAKLLRLARDVAAAAAEAEAAASSLNLLSRGWSRRSRSAGSTADKKTTIPEKSPRARFLKVLNESFADHILSVQARAQLARERPVRAQGLSKELAADAAYMHAALQRVCELLSSAKDALDPRPKPRPMHEPNGTEKRPRIRPTLPVFKDVDLKQAILERKQKGIGECSLLEGVGEGLSDEDSVDEGDAKRGSGAPGAAVPRQQQGDEEDDFMTSLEMLSELKSVLKHRSGGNESSSTCGADAVSGRPDSEEEEVE